MRMPLLAKAVVAAVVCGSGPLASAQVTYPATQPAQRQLNWAEKMFSTLRHDFGNVAKGADARHTLQVKNIYEEDVRILAATTTCGCTAASPDKNLLKTGEVANIEIKMNTVKFERQKNSNVDVAISFTDKRGITSSKSVRVPISAYIRPDVQIEPGGVNFGSVEEGAGAEQRVRVSYFGSNNWVINNVETGSEYLSAQAVETQRSSGVVRYDLVVRVNPNAPRGRLQNKVILHTNDSASATVPVLVEANVEPDIVITPGIVNLGPNLKPGEEKRYTVIVKGRKPFAISNIECNSAGECFKTDKLSAEKKTVHVLPLRFTPPDKPGEFKEEFFITVAGRKKPLVLRAEGTIMATTTSAQTN